VNSTQAVIAVGVDGSAESERAVEWALDEARTHGDTLLLVHAWQFPAVGVTTYAGDPLPVFGHGDIEKLAAGVLADVAQAARERQAGVSVDTRLVEGHPGAALVDASDGARLLVVGSRGLGGFKGMLMGSVSSACAHHARCPVVIVPRADSTRD
jgi:nucleotide-binding universal stress UspA family protein